MQSDWENLMPYIEKAARTRLADRRDDSGPQNVGEVNYLLTLDAIAYIQAQGEVRYRHINFVMGSFERAKHPPRGGFTNITELSNLFRATINRAQARGVIDEIDAYGVVESAKAEFYRRVAVPYEEIQIRKNGEVFPDDVLTFVPGGVR
jgi:hypothetical protein